MIELWTAFVLGLFTPLTAVCVIPLYPGFIAYLSKQLGVQNRKTLALSGVVVTLGVLSFMTLLGLIFTTLLKVSLTSVIGILSPLAFGFLGVVSLFMIFGVNLGKFIPRIQTPLTQNPLKSAFLFGFFFGAIVIPCNPLFIAALFTQVLASVGTFFSNIITFFFFGVGMSFPLLVLAIISTTLSKKIISFITSYEQWILRISGIIMFCVSIYYLFFVFY